MMPRYRVTMRDGRKVEVDAADKDHARSLAAKKVGTSWPGKSAERIDPDMGAVEHRHTHPSGATYGTQKHKHNHGNVQHSHDSLRGGSNNRPWSYEKL